jgi:glycosyltransferase involved in cell wall biosynthesis
MEPLVSVCCLAYNHVKYISNALDGILMQRTNFSFEVIIHDDASTDGTTSIIQEYENKYPENISVIYQKVNQYTKGLAPDAHFVFPKARGKYIALCEADDYWTDPYKLQKQVNILENNTDYGLVHTELDHYYIKSNKYVKNHWSTNKVNNQSGDIYNSLLVGLESMIYTCTVCFRSTYVKNNNAYNNIIKQKFFMMDTPLWLHIAINSKIGYLSESTTVRNVLPFSFTQGRSFDYNMKYIESLWRMVEYFHQIRPINENERVMARNIYYRKKIELCFTYYSGRNILEDSYANLGKEYKSIIIKLKYYGLKNIINYYCARVILKTIKYIKGSS